MSHDRRQFLHDSLAAGAALVLASNARGQKPLADKSPEGTKAGTADKKLKILILGGTGFIGPALVELAKPRGHEITLFNRGRTHSELFPDLEKLHGDRDPKKGEGIKALEGRKWDVVFDDCGYYPRHVKASAELMAANIGHYVYISSISCYAHDNIENQDETAELAKMEDPTVETMGKDYANYGALKALCEQAAEKALPGKTTIVRPGYIVGPGDPTDRFTYWPVRFDKGGTVLVPGDKSDPVQVIDVRDLAEFLLHIGETKTIGKFNACGPEKVLTWGETIEACKASSSAKDIQVKWIAADAVAKLEGVEFPIWAPHSGESKGSHTYVNARAVKAGLKFRPITAITKDTLDWFWQTKMRAGLSSKKEAEILKSLG